MASDVNNAGPEDPPTTSNTVSTTISSPNPPFEFFNLPQELRNKVYSEFSKCVLLPLDNVSNKAEQECALLEPCPIPSLTLVSKQFKQEYEEEINLQTHSLEVNYSHLRHLLFLSSQNPGLASCLRRVQKAELIMTALPPNKNPKEEVRNYLRAAYQFWSLLREIRDVKVSYAGGGVHVLVKTLSERGIGLGDIDPYRRVHWLFAGHSVGEDVVVEKKYVAVGLLFDSNSSLWRRGGYRGQLVDGEKYDRCRKNVVTYVVTAAKDGGWHGLELEIDESNSFAFEEVEADVALGELSAESPKECVLWRTGYKFHKLGKGIDRRVGKTMDDARDFFVVM